MHPFCCVPHHTPSSANPLPEIPIMSSSPARCDHHHTRSNSQILNYQNHNGADGNRLSREVPAVDAVINDIVGNGVSGILHKWVNYGKGWRRRWFVLQDGVLSYYKIHGPDKIIVSHETERGCKVIGEESSRRISRTSNNVNAFQRMRKPFGEVHLKVASIRESRSDDKRFSVFTGTKRLHLRAETREDRAAWMEALQAVKDLFPRISNSDLMAPLDNQTVSTDKLRQRLEEEGVSEAAIQDSEHIMKNEFLALQNQIVLLKQKQWLLIDSLRHLEVQYIRKHRAKRIWNSSSIVSPASQEHPNAHQFRKASKYFARRWC